MRLIHQSLQIVNEALPAVLRVLVVPSDVNCFFRTYFLTVAAEDATELIDLEHERISIPFLVLAGHQLDAVGRADSGTQSAGNALRLTALGSEHAMRSAPARRDRRLLLRILGRDPAIHIEEVLHRERHSSESCPDVADVLDRALHHLHLDRHYLTTSATTPRRRSSWRSFSISLGCILPYAGLMILPRSSMAKRMMISAMFMLPSIAEYMKPWSIPAALSPSITAAIKTM